MKYKAQLRAAVASCLIPLLLSACGAPRQASTQPSTTNPSTMTVATAVASTAATQSSSPAPVEPSSTTPVAPPVASAANASGATTNGQIYYWPDLPAGMIIDTTRSSADETGFTLALVDPSDPQRTLDYYGGPGTPAMARPPAVGSEPIEINGQPGTRFSTGAGTSLHWDENGQPFRISGFFDRDEMLSIVDRAEPLDLAQWRQRLAAYSRPADSGGAATSKKMYLWPTQLPEGFAVQPAQSTGDATSFIVDVADTNTGQFWFTIVGGQSSQAAQPPASRNQAEIIVRGQTGFAYTTGAGYSLYWQENGQPYAIIGGLGLDAALAIAENLELLDLDSWQARRDGAAQ